jgi:hypothetical protein
VETWLIVRETVAIETLAWAATLRMSILGAFEDLGALEVAVRGAAAREADGLLADWGLREFLETLFKSGILKGSGRG